MRRLGGRFVLEREIGAGGMSTVFLGRDEVLDRFVAVKILKSGFDDPDIDARFQREGRTAARLSHPNIVQVYDAGEDEFEGRKISYIVMEYVSGGDLKDLIDKKGPLPEAELAGIGADVAAGLAHAHERGIIHRDIKPQNVLLDSYGRPKLTDFGIARALDSTTSHATRTGSYLGTALYSSPEQLQGEKVTFKSDVYSLGATLYQAATGEPPFSGSPISVASQQISKSPAAPRSRGAAIGESFDRLILGCLKKDPADRPEAADLRERLLQMGAATAGTAGPSSIEGVKTAGAAGLAGAAKAARAAGEAGAAGLGSVVRRVNERFGRSEPSGGSGIPTRTVIVPTRTFRAGPNRAALFAVGAVALLLLLFVVWGASAMLGSGEKADSPGQPAAEKQSAAEDPAAPAGEPKDAADTKDAAAGKAEKEQKATKSPKATGPLPPADAATDAVYNMYVAAGAEDDYARSWGYLSERYKKEIGSVEKWRERYESVSYVFFPTSPTAEIVDGKAEVDFEVRETRDGDDKTVSGTWVCVAEGGEWKLDRLVKDGS